MNQEKIVPSTTESYDVNDMGERVNSILKQEFLLEDYPVDIETMKLIVTDAVHIYNTKRSHWSIT